MGGGINNCSTNLFRLQSANPIKSEIKPLFEYFNGVCALIQVHRYIFRFSFSFGAWDFNLQFSQFHWAHTNTHARTHTCSIWFSLWISTKHEALKKLSRYVLRIYFALVQFLKNSRATSTADDAHLSCGCGATVARGTRWIAGLSMFDATCSRKTKRTRRHLHLKFE